MKNIAIIGHGYVGKAVDHAFNTSQVNKFIVDPIYNSHIGNLKGKKRIDVAFVCVPTPMALDGSIDSSIVEQVVEDLVYFDCMIVYFFVSHDVFRTSTILHIHLEHLFLAMDVLDYLSF